MKARSAVLRRGACSRPCRRKDFRRHPKKLREALSTPSRHPVRSAERRRARSRAYKMPGDRAATCPRVSPLASRLALPVGGASRSPFTVRGWCFARVFGVATGIFPSPGARARAPAQNSASRFLSRHSARIVRGRRFALSRQPGRVHASLSPSTDGASCDSTRTGHRGGQLPKISARFFGRK